MSFLRAAISRQALTAPRTLGTRRYASAPSNSSSHRLTIGLLTFGVAAAGAYYYIDGQPPKQEKSPLDPENFVDFKLKKIIPYNHNTSKFVFELPKNEASLLPITSCIIVKSSDPDALKDAKGKPIIRPYTPISPSDLKGELTFLIKRYDSGNASKHIHSLKEGDTLSIKGPIQKWPYKANEFESIGLIGGGSGITPLYQLAEYVLNNKQDKTKITLLFSNLTEKDILMKDELDGLAKKFPDNFRVVYAVDKPESDWAGPKGYMTSQLLKEYLPSPEKGEKVKVFVCGPPPQMAAISGKKDGMKQGEVGGILKELGYSTDQIFKF